MSDRSPTLPEPPADRRPGHTVSVEITDTRLDVKVGDTTVADTTAARRVSETGLNDRWYIPSQDVDWSLLHPSSTSTYCPYKGTAQYWNVRTADGVVVDDAVWAYVLPFADQPELADLVAFYTEKDGIEQSIHP